MKILYKTIRGAAVCAAMFCALAFAACNVSEMSSLRAFSKPYLGAYECTEARFGGRDILGEFRAVTLTLQEGGTFLLEIVPRHGERKTAAGKYEYGHGETIVFTATARGKTYRKNIAFTGGCFVVEQMFAGQKLFLKFEVKG